MMKEMIQYLLEIKRHEVMMYMDVDVDVSRLPEGMVLECTLDQVR